MTASPNEIAQDDQVAGKAAHPGLSLDVWAVLVAFVLALLVRAGVLQHVGW